MGAFSKILDDRNLLDCLKKIDKSLPKKLASVVSLELYSLHKVKSAKNFLEEWGVAQLKGAKRLLDIIKKATYKGEEAVKTFNNNIKYIKILMETRSNVQAENYDYAKKAIMKIQEIIQIIRVIIHLKYFEIFLCFEDII